MNGRDGDLGRIVGSDALDGKAQDLTSLLVCFSTGAHLCITDDGGRFMDDLILETFKQFDLRFIARKASDLLETSIDLLLGDIQVMLLLIQLALQ